MKKTKTDIHTHLYVSKVKMVVWESVMRVRSINSSDVGARSKESVGFKELRAIKNFCKSTQHVGLRNNTNVQPRTNKIAGERQRRYESSSVKMRKKDRRKEKERPTDRRREKADEKVPAHFHEKRVKVWEAFFSQVSFSLIKRKEREERKDDEWETNQSLFERAITPERLPLFPRRASASLRRRARTTLKGLVLCN